MTPKLLLLTAGLALAAGSLTRAQTPPPAEATAFRPGLGDLMTMLVQPRHIKLGIAGQQQNWTYAAYQLGELQEAFDRVTRLRPRYRDFAVAETMQTIMKQPVTALAEAIRNADAAGFARSYGQLTDACNLCHQGAGREMIVIQVPRTSPWSDQDFQPVKR